MSILDAAIDSLGGTLQDQWKDIVTAGSFDEYTVVAPGVRKRSQNGRGANFGAQDVLSDGSLIFVPENTAAFVFDRAGIEQIITQPGNYEYRNGELSLFDEQDRQTAGIGKIILGQTADRLGFSGMSSQEKRVAFVNLREIRGIKFGTRGPLSYNDRFYGTDLEVFAYGVFSVQVKDPATFVQNFVPANVSSYSLKDAKARKQLVAEFLHSFIAAVNSLSSDYRISQLPSQANALAQTIAEEAGNAGTWEQRFGLKLVAIAIENIEFSDDSRELVRQFSERKMSVAAYEGVSQQAANVAAQQMIAEGVRANGLGDAGGMLFGMNLAQGLNPVTAAFSSRETSQQNGGTQGSRAEAAENDAQSLGEQNEIDADEFNDRIEAVKKLKDLLDMGILSQEEFDAKKRKLLDL